MHREIIEAVAQCVDAEPNDLIADSAVSGGSIHQALRVNHGDGRSFFVKSGPHASHEMFAAEAAGLRELAASATIRVPRNATVASTMPLLVMEWIETGPKPSDFGERLGRELAQLHLATQRPTFGFDHNNWIGATVQPNVATDDWVEFWRVHRLEHQLSLAKHTLRTTGRREAERLQILGRALANRLEEWIGEPKEPACLLHGDLWSGNVVCDEQGDPALVDPAAYYGHREADIAMTFVFGGFDQAFYNAYNQTFPMATGWRKRMPVYELYHLLNHLNLFGTGYLGGCLAKLEHLAG